MSDPNVRVYGDVEIGADHAPYVEVSCANEAYLYIKWDDALDLARWLLKVIPKLQERDSQPSEPQPVIQYPVRDQDGAT